MGKRKSAAPYTAVSAVRPSACTPSRVSVIQVFFSSEIASVFNRGFFSNIQVERLYVEKQISSRN